MPRLAPSEGPVAYDQFVFIDDELARRGAIWMEDSGSRRTETGKLEVWAQLRNEASEPIQVRVRISFFGHDNLPVEGPSDWQRLLLIPDQVATYRATSTGTTGVAHFYVEIQEGA